MGISADERDVDLQYASYLEDIDPISKKGELRGRYGDDEMATSITADLITSWRDGTEAIVWDGTKVKHITSVTTSPSSTDLETPTSSGTASLASLGTTVRVAMGNGSTHEPRWIGYIEHDQFNGAVGPPSGTTHIRDAWLELSFNYYGSGNVATEGDAATAEETVWPEGTGMAYYLSLEYDNYQHGPAYIFSSISNITATSGFGIDQVDITISILPTNFPERVTAVNLWRQDYISASNSPSSPLVLAIRADMADTGWTFNSPDYEIDVTDTGFNLGTWEDITGLPELGVDGLDTSNGDQKIFYQYNTICNGYHFVAKVYHPYLTSTDNWMFRSKRNRPDMYNWSEEYLVLPTEPTAMVTFLGRVYVFGDGVIYRIDPERFEIEDTISGIGLFGQQSIVVTERGMFFCDQHNIYVHDGTQIRTIGNPVLDNDYDSAISWTGASHGVTPICLYDATQDLFIVIFESSSGIYHGFVYSIDNQSWYIYSFSTGFGAPTGGYVSYTGEPVAVFGGAWEHIGGDTSRKGWKWVSKEINNGIWGIVPYWVFIDGDATDVIYVEDCNAGTQILLSQNSNYDGCYHRFYANTQISGATYSSWGRRGKYRLEVNGASGDTVNTLGLEYRKVRKVVATGGDPDTWISTITENIPDTLYFLTNQDEVRSAALDFDNTGWATTTLFTATTRTTTRNLRVAQVSSYVFLGQFSSPNWYIRRHAMNGAGATDIVTSTADSVYFDLDRTNGYVVAIFDDTNNTVVRYDYDGTQIDSFTITSSTSVGPIAVSQDGTYCVYITRSGGVNTLRKLIFSSSTESSLSTSFTGASSAGAETRIHVANSLIFHRSDDGSSEYIASMDIGGGSKTDLSTLQQQKGLANYRPTGLLYWGDATDVIKEFTEAGASERTVIDISAEAGSNAIQSIDLGF